jgi:hypothetical protein
LTLTERSQNGRYRQKWCVWKYGKVVLIICCLQKWVLIRQRNDAFGWR